ncbi:hypothetical protein MSS93_09540 [Deinococcus radiodurans]|nr:hypothetical protein MSS93_09540 [Deinococcus radiodurans]
MTSYSRPSRFDLQRPEVRERLWSAAATFTLHAALIAGLALARPQPQASVAAVPDTRHAPLEVVALAPEVPNSNAAAP